MFLTGIMLGVVTVLFAIHQIFIGIDIKKTARDHLNDSDICFAKRDMRAEK